MMRRAIQALLGLLLLANLAAAQVTTSPAVTGVFNPANPGPIGASTPAAVSATTLTSTGVITEATRAATWQWANWNPADCAGTDGSPSTTPTASVTAASYVTISAATDTTTITFNKAGNYLVSATFNTANSAAVITSGQLRPVIGGTATRYFTPTSSIYYTYPISVAITKFNNLTFLVSATANQTFTIRPLVSIVSAGCTVGNYVTSGALTAVYLGT